MARREIEKEQIRKIQQAGQGSYLVTIPIEMVRKLKWREHQKVVFKIIDRDKILISDWKKRKKKKRR